MITFKKLIDGLQAILKKNPELADREVRVASECGFSDTGFESPVTIAIPIFTPEFKDSNFYVRIVSDDDGYRTNRAIADWKFISPEEGQIDRDSSSNLRINFNF